MNENEKNVRRLCIAVNAIDGLYYRFARGTDVKENTLCLLYALQDGQAHSQKQICEEWLIPKTTINTVTKELEAQGYLRLEALPGRRRELRLYLTEAGQVYAQKVLSPLTDAECAAMDETLRGCPPDFLDTLERYTENLRAVLNADHKKTEVIPIHEDTAE